MQSSNCLGRQREQYAKEQHSARITHDVYAATGNRLSELPATISNCSGLRDIKARPERLAKFVGGWGALTVSSFTRLTATRCSGRRWRP